MSVLPFILHFPGAFQGPKGTPRRQGTPALRIVKLGLHRRGHLCYMILVGLPGCAVPAFSTGFHFGRDVVWTLSTAERCPCPGNGAALFFSKNCQIPRTKNGASTAATQSLAEPLIFSSFSHRKSLRLTIKPTRVVSSIAPTCCQSVPRLLLMMFWMPST